MLVPLFLLNFEIAFGCKKKIVKKWRIVFESRNVDMIWKQRTEMRPVFLELLFLFFFFSIEWMGFFLFFVLKNVFNCWFKNYKANWILFLTFFFFSFCFQLFLLTVLLLLAMTIVFFNIQLVTSLSTNSKRNWQFQKRKTMLVSLFLSRLFCFI